MAASDNSDNIINYAGDFRVKTCTIISYRQAPDSEEAFRVNVLPQLANISIVEDVTSPVITGEIDLIDTNDIRTLLPLVGLERLQLRIFTPGQDEIDFRDEPLYIYKADKIRNTSGTGRQQVYRLYFTSREAYLNNTRRVSRAFAGPLEVAVNELVTDERYLDSRKVLYAEPTATNEKVVIPNLKPLATIKFLQDRAVSSKYKNAGYLFYETTQGFHFRSFESLFAMGGHTARPVTELYAIQPAKVRKDGEQDVIEDLRTVVKYAFVDAVNILEQMNNGLFANRLVKHDIYEKKIETFDYDYHDEFQNHFHTEHDGEGARSATKWLHPVTYLDNTEKTLSDHPMSKLMSVEDTTKKHNDYESTKKEVILPNRTSQRAQMMSHHLTMTVPGQTRINAGQMIAFNLPYQKPVAHDEGQQTNPYYSGRYCILQLKHKFDVINQNHTMNLRCVKDATATDLPIDLENKVVLTDKTDAVSVYDIDERNTERS
jgi:hypothetical protein